MRNMIFREKLYSSVNRFDTINNIEKKTVDDININKT